MSAPLVEHIGHGVYAVTIDGRREVVYAAKNASGAWAFCNGALFRGEGTTRAGTQRKASAGPALPLTAPMPATVLKLNVAAGSVVKKGDTLLILEAMKMELPLRASSDGTVKAVHCRVGELVQPDTVLIELA